MTRVKINIDTDTQIAKFVSVAVGIPRTTRLDVVDGDGMRVSARSILGMLYAMTFSELWLESDEDVYNAFRDFIVID